MFPDRSGGRRGFILATSLLVLTLLTVMLTAAFVLVSAEFRTTDNAAASARALGIAEAGLQHYLSLNRGLLSSNTYDSLRISPPAITGGYADVVAQRVRTVVGGTPSLWSLRSTGYPSDALLSGTPSGKRTVARLAHLYPGQLPARAALVALNGVQFTGTDSLNPVTGVDVVGTQPGCTSPGTPVSDSFAISVFRNAGQYIAGGAPVPAGRGVDSLAASQSILYDTTHINWAALTDTTSANFTPDYTIPPGSIVAPGPTTNYLVGYAPGNFTLTAVSSYSSNPRKGVLVVGGDLTLADETHWDGVILVGGRLLIASASTNYIIDGQVITGLNTRLSPPVAVGPNLIPRTADDRFSTRLAWSWCYATIAANSLSGFAPVKRAWTDGWALY